MGACPRRPENGGNGMPDNKTIEMLIDQALSMMDRSYIPYSNFAVGAALLCEDGTVYTGCNIENAAYTPTICAERTAFFKAVSEGKTSFKAIAIAGGADRIPDALTSPCGVCRQVMMEFCNPADFYVIMADGPNSCRIRTLEELLPLGFGPGNMKIRPMGGQS